jgi:hypothetical protein
VNDLRLNSPGQEANVTSDEYGPPLNHEEWAAARKYVDVWKKRALYFTCAFFISCMSVTPFLEGHFLHAYFEPFGKIALFLSVVLLVPFVACAVTAITLWLDLLRQTKLARQ